MENLNPWNSYVPQNAANQHIKNRRDISSWNRDKFGFCSASQNTDRIWAGTSEYWKTNVRPKCIVEQYDFNTMTLSLNLIRNITHFKVCNTKNLNRFMFLSILTSSLFMKQLIIEFIVFIVWNRFVSWFFGIYSLFELNWIRSINKIIFNLFISFMYWESIKISSKRYHFDVKKKALQISEEKKRRRHL